MCVINALCTVNKRRRSNDSHSREMYLAKIITAENATNVCYTIEISIVVTCIVQIITLDGVLRSNAPMNIALKDIISLNI